MNIGSSLFMFNEKNWKHGDSMYLKGWNKSIGKSGVGYIEWVNVVNEDA